MAAVAEVVMSEFERNGRCTSRMDDDTRLIHARLEEWSREAKGAFAALGFPRQSIYERWALLCARPDYAVEQVMSERAWNVDQAVRKLGEIDRSVVWRFYLDYRPGDALWKRLPGVESRSHFDRVLKRARFRVSGFLAAIE